jgi:hypothetical protein
MDFKITDIDRNPYSCTCTVDAICLQDAVEFTAYYVPEKDMFNEKKLKKHLLKAYEMRVREKQMTMAIDNLKGKVIDP